MEDILNAKTGTMPKLTLTPDIETRENVSISAAEAAAPVQEQQLTPEEEQMVTEFAKQIDISDSQMVLLYGATAQQKISEFSNAALANVKTKDSGAVGDMLSGLVVELKGFSIAADEKTGWFRSLRKKAASLKARYDTIEKNIDNISNSLENHQVTLLKDIAVYDKMYEMNKDYFKELSLYIIAGERKLAEVREKDVPAMLEKAHASNDPSDIQAANDLIALCDRFEKKLYDLKLTRQVSIQMAPQIRMLQNNDSMLVEKIQSSLVNTIPLWKSQILLSLGLSNSQKALKAQREVTDLTNQLLKSNAEMLKQGTIETARENERGIIDIETLKQTNASLISTIDEVIKIQTDGRAQRRAAEAELATIENQLKDKLYELRG